MSNKPKGRKQEEIIGGSEPPEWLEKLPPDQRRLEDNFDHTDLVWTGADGELDPDQLISDHGRDSRTPLFQVVLALVAGHQPDLRTDELATTARKACRIIEGSESKGGRPPAEDGTLLMEIAYRYHEALYHAGVWPAGAVEIAPIVRAVVLIFGLDAARSRNVNSDNLEEILARKFRDNKDLWLARVTTEDPYYNPERFDDLKTLRAGLEALARAGVKVDPTKITATTRPDEPRSDETAAVK